MCLISDGPSFDMRDGQGHMFEVDHLATYTSKSGKNQASRVGKTGGGLIHRVLSCSSASITSVGGGGVVKFSWKDINRYK